MQSKRVFFDGLDLHPFLAEVVHSPPVDGFEYFEIRRGGSFLDLNKRLCVPYPFYPFLNFPYYPKRFLRENDVALIHSFKAFPLNSFPWVADVEHFNYLNNVFYRFQGDSVFTKGVKSFFSRLLLKRFNSRHCRKVMPWSEHAYSTIAAAKPPKGVLEKTEVVYPGISVRGKRVKRRGKPAVYFIPSRHFDLKGGSIALDVFSALSKKIDAELKVFGAVQQGFAEKFPGIDFLFVSREEFIGRFLPRAELVIAPSLMESFNISLLEAQSFGIPAVCSDVMTLPEIVEDGRTGFLVRYPKQFHKEIFCAPWKWAPARRFLDEKALAEEFLQKSLEILENSSLRKRLGRNARQQVERGKFSLQKRKNTLKRVWGEAIQ